MVFVVLERDTQALGASVVEEEFHRWQHPQLKVFEDGKSIDFYTLEV